jgi:hypothetical protein
VFRHWCTTYIRRWGTLYRTTAHHLLSSLRFLYYAGLFCSSFLICVLFSLYLHFVLEKDPTNYSSTRDSSLLPAFSLLVGGLFLEMSDESGSWAMGAMGAMGENEERAMR